MDKLKVHEYLDSLGQICYYYPDLVSRVKIYYGLDVIPLRFIYQK